MTPTAPGDPASDATVDNTLLVRMFAQRDGTSISTDPTTNRATVTEDSKILLGVGDTFQALATTAVPSAQFTTDEDNDWTAATVILAPDPQPVVTIDKDTTTVGDIDATGTANYTIVVTNTDTALDLSALGVTITDSLPSGFSFSSGSVGFAGCADTTVDTAPTAGQTSLTWGTFDMEENCVITVTFAAIGDGTRAPGIMNNPASAAGSNFTTVTDPGTDTDEDVTVIGEDLSFTKTVSNSTPNEGDSITYTLTATNAGPGSASGVVITDILPSDVTFVSGVITTPGSDTGTCVEAPTDTVTCTFSSTIASGGTAVAEITVTVDSGLTETQILTNNASVTEQQVEIDTTNNSATAPIAVCPANNIYNVATVAVDATQTDSDLTNNTDDVCTLISQPDFGDAPDSYGTTIASGLGAARHNSLDPAFTIGILVDGEVDGVPTTGANGDDLAAPDDEDGIIVRSNGGAIHAEVFADVTTVNTTGNAGTVCVWMDRWTDGGGGAAATDGAFDVGDAQDVSEGTLCDAVGANSGTVVHTFRWTNLPLVTGSTIIRARLCTNTTSCNTPTGTAADGEVEDFFFPFNFLPTAVTIGTVQLAPVSVSAFLNQIGVGDMSRAEMLALLEAWDADAAAALANADAATIVDALMAYLDPDGDGSVALLAWDTLSEVGTIGFYAERQDGEDNWVRINDRMLPGLITAPMGGEYMLADPTAQPGNEYMYRLIEQEANGLTRTYGPFTVEMQ